MQHQAFRKPRGRPLHRHFLKSLDSREDLQRKHVIELSSFLPLHERNVSSNAHFEGVKQSVLVGMLSIILERIDEVLEKTSSAICRCRRVFQDFYLKLHALEVA